MKRCGSISSSFCLWKGDHFAEGHEFWFNAFFSPSLGPARLYAFLHLGHRSYPYRMGLHCPKTRWHTQRDYPYTRKIGDDNRSNQLPCFSGIIKLFSSHTARRITGVLGTFPAKLRNLPGPIHIRHIFYRWPPAGDLASSLLEAA